MKRFKGIEMMEDLGGVKTCFINAENTYDALGKLFKEHGLEMGAQPEEYVEDEYIYVFEDNDHTLVIKDDTFNNARVFIVVEITEEDMIKSSYQTLPSERKVSLLTELYLGLLDGEKDEFLRRTENN